MSIAHNASIVTDGLVLCLDAANPKSYPGSGDTWYDVSGSGNDFDMYNSVTYSSSGYMTFGTTSYIQRPEHVTAATSGTAVFWIKTSDDYALFLNKTATSAAFLGAYRSGNKFYNGQFGTPTFHMDGISKENIYDFLPDGQWHMAEFKNVDFSLFSVNLQFNYYNQTTGYQLMCDLGVMSIYDRSISEAESWQNFNALRGRYGL